MSRLLNALLDISKLESGRGQTRNPPISGWLRIFEELRLEFAGVAISKGLNLEIERAEDGRVYTDPSW